jgi:DNA polymerase-3 subunit epsilon
MFFSPMRKNVSGSFLLYTIVHMNLSHTLQGTFAIVDVETTGMRAAFDQIIEIGIVLVKDGVIIDTYRSLVKPDQSVNPYILSMTGITSESLTYAPSFEEIARDIHALVDGAIFVAHNARFDYAFVKNELRRAGFSFKAKTLCTVKLSRKLSPQASEHNLDAVSLRYGISIHNRHRAFDDALAVWNFLEKALEEHGIETFQTALRTCLGEHTLPSGISKQIVSTLPDTPGVYIFYGADGEILYVGKSKNIKTRVLSHFSSDHQSSKELRMCREIESIETRQTPGELGALLLESHLVKQLQPKYNRMLRRQLKLVIARQIYNESGYASISIERTSELEPDNLSSVVGVFRSIKQAKTFLEEACAKHNLCPKLSGTESGDGQCFASQLGKCHGACINKEGTETYNARACAAFDGQRVRSWPYAGPIAITEYGTTPDSYVTFIVDKWRVYKTIEYANNEIVAEDDSPRNVDFDFDTYKILAHYLLSKRKKHVSVLDSSGIQTTTSDVY